MSGRVQTDYKPAQPFVIRLNGRDYRLSFESLRKRVPATLQKITASSSVTLQFLSYADGSLQLLHTHDKKSHQLTLSLQDQRLLVSCSCHHPAGTCCGHIYSGLRALISAFGETYFAKFQKDGAMQLAFQHGNYFDKQQTKVGLTVSVRPELETVYALNDRLTQNDLLAILALPVTSMVLPDPLPARDILPGLIKTKEEAIGYLLTIPVRGRFLPFLLPTAGKLNKAGKGIKLFYHHLSGAKKTYSHLLREGQKELNQACFDLYKRTEQLSGHLFTDNAVKANVQKKLSVFTAWQHIFGLLIREKWVYAYELYRMDELKKGRPLQQRLQAISIGKQRPEIGFVLADCGAFYQLSLRVWIGGKEIPDYNTEIPFFLKKDTDVYLLSTLRDAALLQWMSHLGGQITVFKVHYPAFKKEILDPIRQYYPVKEVQVPKPKRPLQL